MVFFDLDGTLHQQNMFSYFLFYLILHFPFNILLVVFFLPIIVIGLLINGKLIRWPMSLFLWSITFGHKELKLKKLQNSFIVWFSKKIKRFPRVYKHLYYYLFNTKTQIWLITGSPQLLAEKIYHDILLFYQVQLIGSKIHRKYGGWILSLRCLGYEKTIQLKRRITSSLILYSGYSDSIHDNYLLFFCKNSWRVTNNGNVKKINLN